MLPASPCWAWGWGRSWTAGFYLLPAAVAGFLLQHALQGWCPPMPLFRSLGVRTASEIAEERYALKILRGDFRDVPPVAEGAPRPTSIAPSRLCDTEEADDGLMDSRGADRHGRRSA